MLIMAVSASDVQFWLWKMLKASSKNCVVIMLKYPLISCSSLCLFFLYICFPLIFWSLIYSAPLVVLIPILRKPFSVQNGNKISEKEKKDENNVVVGEDGKPFRRVHSVRRRRAKGILREDNNEEKIEVSSTSFNADQVIDKSTLIEESTNEIRDVEVDSSASAKDSSSTAFQNPKPEIGKESHIKSLDVSGEDEEAEKEDQDNVMEVGISEIERNKRLESLIARRRARKLLSLQVRRTLMSMDRNDLPAPIAFPSLVIPKHNNGSFLPNSSFSSHISTIPGSAPSILIPMRNPFDLPYDPQEEKPDLSGDSFQQEFTSPRNKDAMFCRHESFSLGPSLPEEFNQGREKASFQHDFGFRNKASPQGYEFYTPAPRFFTDRESTTLLEPGPTQVPETNSVTDTEDDQIKEVIQVCENDIDKNDNKDNDEAEMKPVPVENSSTTSSSSTSSEEDTTFFKIDKEAVLKNLFSPRTQANKINRIGDNSNYFASPLKRNSLEEHMYQANRTMRRHAPSYSIASDLQVEFSEVSSPQTVDDNEDASDMEQKIDLASGNLSSDLTRADRNEYRLRELDEISEGDLLEVGYSRINSSEDLSSTNEDPVIEQHKIHSCFSSDSLQEEITDVFGVNGNEYSSREIDEISEDIGYSRVNSSEDLSNTIEDSVVEKNKIHLCSSLPLVPELIDSSQSLEMNQISFSSDSLQEKLPESSQSPAQENGQQSIHENDYRKQLDDSKVQSKQFETPESETIDHADGQSSTPAGCHLTEHSSDGNVRSSEESRESEEKVVTPIIFEIQDNFEHHEGEPRSSTQIIMDSDNPQEVLPTQIVAFQRIPFIRSSTPSPKSVLQPSFSVDLGSTASFDQYIDREQFVRNNVEVLSPAGSQNLSPTIEQPTAIPSSDANGDVRDVEISQDLAEPSTPYVEVGNIESINELKSHENGEKPEEVASDSSQTLTINEAPPEQFKLIEESGSNCYDNHDEFPNKNFDAANATAFSGEMDSVNNSNSLQSVDEESFTHQEITGDAVKHDNNNRPSTNVDQRENSTVDEDTEHEHNLDNPNDHKGTTNTTSSSCLGEKQDEILKFSAVESSNSQSAPVEDNKNSEYREETEHVRKAKENADSNE